MQCLRSRKSSNGIPLAASAKNKKLRPLSRPCPKPSITHLPSTCRSKALGPWHACCCHTRYCGAAPAAPPSLSRLRFLGWRQVSANLEDRLRRLVCILLPRWGQQDRAQNKIERQAVFREALESDLRPWFSVFCCSSVACILGGCWALSVIMRARAAGLPPAKNAFPADAIKKLLQVR